MTSILVETLADARDGSRVLDATITATATRARATGAILKLPEPVEVRLRRGQLERPLILDAPDGTWAWKISVRPTGAPLRHAMTGTYRFAGETVTWEELQPVDPKTLVPLNPVPPNVQQVLDLATAKAAAAETAANNAASAQASSAGFASASSAAAADAAAAAVQSANSQWPFRTSLVRRPGVLPGPVFQKNNGPVISAASMEMSTIYWPSVLRIDELLPDFGAKYVMLVSTDHNATTGGVYLAESDNLITWTKTTKTPNGLVYVDTAVGKQTETPSVFWNELEGLFFMLYQQQSSGSIAGQATLLATSPDLLVWTRVGIVIDAFQNIDYVASEGHYGYARISQHGGGFMAHHLITGGIYARRGVSYSLDGRHWRQDPRHIENEPQFASDVTRQSQLGEIFLWNGEFYGLGVDRTVTGTNLLHPVIGRVTADLRRWAEVPYPPFPVGDQLWEGPFVRSVHIFSDAGKLYLFYQVGNSIGVAISEVTS